MSVPPPLAWIRMGRFLIMNSIITHCFFPLHYLIFSPIIITMPSRHTAYPQYQPSLAKMHPLVPRHLLPINLLKICEADARSAQKTPAGTVNNIRPCTLFTYTFAMQTCYCIEPPPSVAVLIRRGLFAVAAWTPLVLTSSEFRLYAKLTVKTIQGCIVLAMQQRRYAAYLQKGLDTPIISGIIFTAHSSQLTAHSSQLTAHSVNCI